MTDNTTNNNNSGGSRIALRVGGLVVFVLIIAFVVFSNRGVEATDGTDVSVDIDELRRELPDALNTPNLPDVSPVNPPTLPPEPAPAT